MQAIAFWQDNCLEDVDYVLLLPENETADFASLVDKAFCLKLGSRSGKIIRCKHTDKMIDLYSLYAFTDKLIIGSLDLPHGRKLRNLLDSGIATEDELINDVILGEL